MRQNKRRTLFLEPLENRWVPATVRLVPNGTLLVSNPSVTLGSSSIQLTATSLNQFNVFDNGHFNGNFNVGGNVDIFGSNAKETITVDMAGQTYTGNLLILTGNGQDTVNIQSTSGPTATIAGNVTIIPGNGNDSVNINTTGFSLGKVFGGTSFRIGGTLNVTTVLGHESFALGNAFATTTVGGDVTLANPSNVIIGQGQADSIGGSLTIGSTLVSTGVNATLGTPSVGIFIGKNFNLTGGSGNDTLAVLGSTIIGGNVNVNLTTAAGVGGDSINFATTVLVSGNLSIQTGEGSTTFDTGIGASSTPFTVQGNANFNFGNSDNSFLPTGDITVFGNLGITAGNGDNTIKLGSPGNATIGGFSHVNGNLIINIGNGNDSTIVNGTVGGLVIYHAGSGKDYLQLGNGSASINYNGNAVFGNGDDTLTLATGGSVQGTYIGGTSPNNVFNQSLGSVTATLSPFFTLINFP